MYFVFVFLSTFLKELEMCENDADSIGLAFSKWVSENMRHMGMERGNDRHSHTPSGCQPMGVQEMKIGDCIDSV